MISKYTMATAGHCIYDDENKCFATSIIADFGTVGDSVSLSVPSDRIKTYVYYKSGGKLYSYATHIYGGNYGRRLSSGLMTWLSDNGFLK